MIRKKGNLFEPESFGYDAVDAICITTNGAVRSNGHAVMGKGLALQASNKWPSISKTLGSKITIQGHRVLVIGPKFSFCDPYAVVSFPTKPVADICSPNKDNVMEKMRYAFKPGDLVPGYHCMATRAILARSCDELLKLTEDSGWLRVALPVPAVGQGGMDRREVMAMLGEKWDKDDRFIIVEQ